MRRFFRVLFLSVVLGTFGLPLAGIGTAAAAPPVPSLLSPNEGASVTANPVLEWNAVAGAVKYDVYVDTDAAFSPPHSYAATVYSTKATPTSDLPQTTLYWRVRSLDAVGGVAGTSNWSDIRSFTKVAPPGPTLVAPTNSTVWKYPSDNNQDTPSGVFSWTPPAGGAAAKSYTLEVDTASDFVPPLAFAAVTTNNTTWALTAPQTMGQTYFWRVKAKTASGTDSQWSPTGSYSWTWPDVPALLTPQHNETRESVVYSWAPVLGSTAYHIQVGPDFDFSGSKAVDTEIISTSYTTTNVLPNAQYFWRVRAKNAAGAFGSWSTVRSFTRAWPAADGTAVSNQNAVTLLTPAHDTEVSVPTYSWTPQRRASHYTVYLSEDSDLDPLVSSCTTHRTTVTPFDECYGIDPVPGRRYYWAVRAFESSPATVNGVMSATSSFVYNPARYAGDVNPQPGNVTLVAPAHLATTATPVLSWLPLSGIERYQVTIKNAADGITERTVTTSNTAYVPQEIALGAGNTNKIYQWYVRSVDHQGRAGNIPHESTWRTFTLTQKTPSASAAPFTVGAPRSTMRAPVLSWNPVASGTYRLLIQRPGATSWSFWSPVGLTEPNYAHDLPLGLGVWLVRLDVFVNGIYTAGYEQSMTIGAFDRVTLTAPPTDCTPAADCPDLIDTPTFTWNPVPGAQYYKVTLAEDVNWTNPIPGFEYITPYPVFTPLTSYNDDQAIAGRYWYAQPCAGFECGPPPASYAGTPNPPTGNFRKQSRPVELVSPVPSGGTPVVVTDQVTFRWQDYLVTNYSSGKTPVTTQEAEAYQVQVSAVPDFASILNDSGYVDETTYTPPLMTFPEGPLYWRVRAIDSTGNTLSWSEEASFWKTSPLKRPAGTPACTETLPGTTRNCALRFPAPGATVGSVPSFTVYPQEYTKSYQIEIYKNLDQPLSGANKVLEQTSTMTTMSFTGSLPAGTYGWRMRRVDVGNQAGPWSADTNTMLRTFTVNSAVVELLTPVSGSQMPLGNPFFSWQLPAGSARYPQYRIQTSTSPSFATLKEDVTTVMLAWAPTTSYAGGTPWYWRVHTLDAAGNIQGTANGEFGSTGTFFHPIDPVRVLDSRPSGPAKQFSSPWDTNITRDVTVAGANGVPADAVAVALNATVTETKGSSFLTVYPAGEPTRPLAANLGWSPGQTVANAVTVKVSSGKVKVFNLAGKADVIFDVVGYYDYVPADGFTSQAPVRIQDSRVGAPTVGAYNTPWSGTETRKVAIAGVPGSGVPADATAVVFNATVANTTGSSFLTIWPSGQAKPNVSSLGWVQGNVLSNAVTVKLGTGGDNAGKVEVYNHNANTDVIFDVVGYFKAGSGALFYPLAPSRIQDSRPDGPAVGTVGAWGGFQQRDVNVIAGGVTPTATAALLNFTAVPGNAGSYATVWPAGQAKPNASSIQIVPGPPVYNSVTVKIGEGGVNAGKVSVYNLAGSVHMIFDIAGYYK